MRLSIATFAIVLLVAFSANAEQGRLGNRGEKVPLSELTTLTQRAGESKDDFLLRTSQWLSNYTTGTNKEVCANICAAPTGALSMRLTTNHSHIACGLTDRCAEGFVSTGESIHSHPGTNNFAINDSDRAFMRDRASSANSVSRRARFTPNPEDFSPQDIAGGPGYLVAQGRLLYQNGAGTSRVVLTLPAAEVVSP